MVTAAASLLSSSHLEAPSVADPPAEGEEWIPLTTAPHKYILLSVSVVVIPPQTLLLGVVMGFITYPALAPRV